VILPALTRGRVPGGGRPVNLRAGGWSGTFPLFPSSPGEMRTWLGVDGSVSPDLGDPEWMYDLNSASPPNLGVSGVGGDTLSLTPGGGRTPPTLVTRPAYGDGTRDLWESDVTTYRGAASSGAQPPTGSAYDGDVSWCGAFICEVDVLNAATSSQYLWNCRNTSSPNKGWAVAALPAASVSAGKIIFQIDWGATIDVVTTENRYDGLGPVLVIFNADFAAGVLKLITPYEYVETPITGLPGNYNPSPKALNTGVYTAIATTGSFTGVQAQFFFFQYPGALNAQIGPANVLQFLKFTDGFLS